MLPSTLSPCFALGYVVDNNIFTVPLSHQNSGFLSPVAMKLQKRDIGLPFVRQSVSPSVRLLLLNNLKSFPPFYNLYIDYNPTPFIQAISDGGHLALRYAVFFMFAACVITETWMPCLEKANHSLGRVMPENWSRRKWQIYYGKSSTFDLRRSFKLDWALNSFNILLHSHESLIKLLLLGPRHSYTFLDVSKAFDNVHHPALLQCLDNRCSHSEKKGCRNSTPRGAIWLSVIWRP